MKKLFAGILFLTCVIVIGVNCFSNEKTANVVVNGTPVETDAVIINDRVMVPIRGVYEQLGFTVEWDDSERCAYFSRAEQYMRVWADSEQLEINGEAKTPDTPPQIINDRLYLPLRFTGEAFVINVRWDEETKTAYLDEVKGALPVPETPQPDVMAENAFAYNMNELMPQDKNYMFSPLSIKMALALAANGAGGQTQQQILSTIGADSMDNFNSYANSLINSYNSQNAVELNVANSLWLNTERAPGITFNDAYVKKMAKLYDATLENVTYNNAVEKINNWCDDKTKGKIPKIIDDSQFLAALVNAIYFKGEWANQFEEHATRKAEFSDRNGKTTETDFMNITDRFYYYEDNDIQIVKMPYKGNETAMYVVLNNDKPLDNLADYIDKMQSEKVHISLPKFKIEYSVTLNDMLAALGIETAFDGSSADFYNMFDNYKAEDRFFINKVLHKTFIEVDENGTEAAAVTAIIMENCTAIAEPEEIKQFIADKPFSFVIADANTNEILFMGEYAFVE